jgi:hypothetical protein
MIEQPSQGDELDALIGRTMKAQPTHRLQIDLATVAMQKARRAPADATILMAARVNRWNRLATAVAMVLIVVVSAWIFHSRLADGGFQDWFTQSASTTTTSTTTTTDSSTTAMEWMLTGAALAIGALVVVLGQRAMNSGDELTWGLVGSHS